MAFLGETRSQSTQVVPAWLAWLWGILFGGLNLAWSLGADWGLTTLAQSIQDEVAAGNNNLLVINTVGGVGKIALGFLALATIKDWGRAIPSRALTIGLYVIGGLLLLYGLANWIQLAIAELGWIDPLKSIGEGPARWYLTLWEPLWMLGGLLLIWTARAFDHRWSS